MAHPTSDKLEVHSTVAGTGRKRSITNRNRSPEGRQRTVLPDVCEVERVGPKELYICSAGECTGKRESGEICGGSSDSDTTRDIDDHSLVCFFSASNMRCPLNLYCVWFNAW